MSKKNPLVSVVMSAYNCEKYVAESIESILNQAFTDFEFIIINDGSTDDTLKIIKEYKDPRITLISRENKGLVASLNEGIENAEGKYVARQDADDVSSPKRLELQVELLESTSGVGLVGSSYKIMNEKSKDISYVAVLERDSDIRYDLLLRNPFCHGAAMFRKDIVQRAGMYKATDYPAEDYALFSRISQIAKVANLPQYLYRWRKESASISHMSANMQQDTLKRMMSANYLLTKDSLGQKQLVKNFEVGLRLYSTTGYPAEYKQQQMVTYSKLPFVMWVHGDKLKALRLAISVFFRHPAASSLFLQLFRTKKEWLQGRRLTILVSRNAENYFGGAERFIVQLSSVLTQCYEGVVVSTSIDKLSNRLERVGIDRVEGEWLENKGGKRTLLRLFKILPVWTYKNLRLMRSQHIGVINAHSRDDQIMFTLTRTIHRRKVIWTDHGDMKHHLAYLKGEGYIERIYHWAIARADVLVFVSDAEKTLVHKELRALNIREPNMVVVPNGVMFSDYSSLKPKKHTQSDIVTLGVVCNLFEAKGVDTFLGTISALRAEGITQLRGIVVGDGPSKNTLLKLRRELHLEEIVGFEGFKKDVMPYLERFDIFLLPTQYEGAPISVLEAMYAGKPIVAYSVGGLPEQIQQGKTGYLVPPNNKDELTMAVKRLVENPEIRERMGEEARTRVMRDFDLQTIVRDRYIPLFTEMRSRGRRK